MTRISRYTAVRRVVRAPEPVEDHKLLAANAMLLEPAPPQTPEDILIERQRGETIRRLIGTLKPREERVLRLRCGIDCDEQTLDQVGELFGVSRERIRQIEAKGMRKLKHPYRSKHLDNVFFDRRHGKAYPRLHMPQWRRNEIAAAERRKDEQQKAADKIAKTFEYVEEQSRLKAQAAVAARDAQAAVAARQEKTYGRSDRREAIAKALGFAIARARWEREASLRAWAYEESQRALREALSPSPRPPWMTPTIHEVDDGSQYYGA